MEIIDMISIHKLTISLILIFGFALLTAGTSSAQLIKLKQKDRFKGTYVGKVIARVVPYSGGKSYEKVWEDYSLEIKAEEGEKVYTVNLLVSWEARETTRSGLEFPEQTHTVPDIPRPYKINGGDASFYGRCVDILMVGMADQSQITLSFNGCRD